MTATATDPRAEAITQIDNAWETALKSNGTDAAIAINIGLAQVSALIYIGDAISDLREEIRWNSERNETRPGDPCRPSIAELFRDTTPRPAGGTA